jgi:hypothetical protein
MALLTMPGIPVGGMTYPLQDKRCTEKDNKSRSPGPDNVLASEVQACNNYHRKGRGEARRRSTYGCMSAQSLSTPSSSNSSFIVLIALRARRAANPPVTTAPIMSARRSAADPEPVCSRSLWRSVKRLWCLRCNSCSSVQENLWCSIRYSWYRSS